MFRNNTFPNYLYDGIYINQHCYHPCYVEIIFCHIFHVLFSIRSKIDNTLATIFLSALTLCDSCNEIVTSMLKDLSILKAKKLFNGMLDDKKKANICR